MPQPYDVILNRIRQVGYHDHRSNSHDATISPIIVNDLAAVSPAFDEHLRTGVISAWHYAIAPDGRSADLIVGPAGTNGRPDLNNIRLIVEHKSLIASQKKNTSNRFQDLERLMQATHQFQPAAIVVATILIGTSLPVLNVSDCVKKHHPAIFEANIRPRLSSGDGTLWVEFPTCVTNNREGDARGVVQRMRQLPLRAQAMTHSVAFDYVLMIPLFVNNVDPPHAPAPAVLGVDAVEDYQAMIRHIADCYQRRWV